MTRRENESNEPVTWECDNRSRPMLQMVDDSL